MTANDPTTLRQVAQPLDGGASSLSQASHHIVATEFAAGRAVCPLTRIERPLHYETPVQLRRARGDPRLCCFGTRGLRRRNFQRGRRDQ